MRRIESQQHPVETRRMLRERLSRFLPVNAVPSSQIDSVARPLVSDSDIVSLLLNLEILSGDDIGEARLVYERAVSEELAASAAASPMPLGGGEQTLEIASSAISDPHIAGGDEDQQTEPRGRAQADPAVALVSSSEAGAPLVTVRVLSSAPSLEGLSPPPSFDKLIERGWIRASWGRISVPREIFTAVLRDRRPGRTAFMRLLTQQERDVLRLKKGFKPSGMLEKMAAEIIAQEHGPGPIVCVSPAWVAARIWDGIPDASNASEPEQRVGDWVDRWGKLGFPMFAISSQLDKASYGEFVDASLKLLASPTVTSGWEGFLKAMSAPASLLHRCEAAAGMPDDTAIPATALGRLRWMGEQAPDSTYHELLFSRSASLMSVLLNELRYAAHDPTGLARDLIGIALDRPVLFKMFVQAAESTPSLLADLLLTPSTCALACGIIAGWNFNPGAWNRQFQARADSATEVFAFEDAIAVLGGHLDAGALQAGELAALYLHVYELAVSGRSTARRLTMLSLLRAEITGAGPDVQDDVSGLLMRLARASRSPLTGFCAALDIISSGDCVARIDPSDVVSIYLEMVLPKGETEGTVTFNSQVARTLGKLALRCEASLQEQFFGAIDIQTWLGLIPPQDTEAFVYLDLLKRRILLHIRALSCAIAGWPSAIPGEFVEALARTIHAGAIDHKERGRIDAFVVRAGLGLSSVNQQPIALDLAAVLRRVDATAVQRIVTELCQLEEPVVLAGIISNTPPSIHEQIKARLRQMTPACASRVSTFPAMQARVDALLSAGLADVAEVFLAAEISAETLGPVPSRAVAEIRQSLQLLLLREDWSTIASFQVPGHMNEHQKREAHDTLLFFQALAEIRKTGGSPEAAENIFRDLTDRHHGVLAYPINLFASRVHRLLAGDMFRLLEGDALGEASRYLADVALVTRPLIQHSPQDLKALDINRAILLLAVDRPAESHQILLALREAVFEEFIEGLRALSIARLGGRGEALSILKDAEHIFDRSPFLSAVRLNIDSHIPYAAIAHFSIDDDPVPGIRHAFEAFSRLDHVEQAQILQSRGRLDLYLLDQVRGACASLVALAPMMRELGLVRYEDDISGVLKQILLSRLLVAQWTVSDQSRGGFSASGGVGERDIIVGKGPTTLAVIEAVITDHVETANLASHFAKLFGYDTCRFFFHLTYARRSNCSRIVNYLKSAATAPPPNITYTRTEDLPDLDSMPVGFRAYYGVDDREVVVAFLVLEMGQPLQRAAAAAQ